MSEVIACRCDGTGKLAFSQTHLDRAGNKIGFTRGSHPCPCRSQAEPRYGKAAWWSSEQIRGIDQADELGVALCGAARDCRKGEA